jgi:hypothetical protein
MEVAIALFRMEAEVKKTLGNTHREGQRQSLIFSRR